MVDHVSTGQWLLIMVDIGEEWLRMANLWLTMANDGQYWLNMVDHVVMRNRRCFATTTYEELWLTGVYDTGYIITIRSC